MYSMGMSMDSIALKCDCEPWHLTPDGKHGYLYTAEEVYGMIIKAQQGNKRNKVKYSFDADDHGIDDHGMWEPFEDSATEEEWDKLIEDAANLVSQNAGTLPGEIERKLEAIRNPKHNWRSVLTNFIHEEVNDYSFSPPDKRFEGDFFLPDFNDVDVTVKNILFIVDTSGSMSEKMITEMYS
jgi:predicted metal-dependent peptidase